MTSNDRSTIADIHSSHAMFSASLKITPLAALSRLVAGTRKQTVIITLPGSPKAALQNLEAVHDILPHACQLAAGVSSRELHNRNGPLTGTVHTNADQAAFMIRRHQSHHEQSGQVHDHQPRGFHDHSHHAPIAHTMQSNDPSSGASQRHRSSPYPMISVEDAHRILTDAAHDNVSTIEIPVDENALGFTLTKSYSALEDVPAFPTSIVDGYAVRVEEGRPIRKGVYSVAAVSRAEPSVDQTVGPDSLVRISTGAPIPTPANAVIMVEDTRLVSTTSDGLEELQVDVLTERIKIGENVRLPGSDIKQDSMSPFDRDSTITPSGGELGWLISAGYRTITVVRRPTVAVLSTGAELVHAHDARPLRRGQVRDTNRPTLLAALKDQGFQTVDLGIVADDEDSVEAAIRGAMVQADVLVTTGGASMGELDLLKPVLERRMGGQIHFGRVNMKPGKPTAFVTIEQKRGSGEFAGRRTSFPVFTLPGNPASAMVTFYLFVLHYLNAVSRLRPLPIVRISVSQILPLDFSRPEYHRAHACFDSDGKLRAESTGGQRSSRIGSMAGANILICKPSAKEWGSTVLAPGSLVDALVIGRLYTGSSGDLEIMRMMRESKLFQPSSK